MNDLQLSMTEVNDTISSTGDNATDMVKYLKPPYACGPMEDWMVAMNVLHIVINMVSALITLLANTVFLIIYFKTPSLRTPHYFLLMLLAITDISVGLVTQPLFIAVKIMEIYSTYKRTISLAVEASTFYFTEISFFTVTLVSIDRYLAVCHPFKHRNEVTKSRIAIVAGVVWAVCLAVLILRVVFQEHKKVFEMFMLGMILVLFGANVCIYAKIYRSFTRRRLQNNSPQLNNVTRVRERKEEAHLAKTAVLLMTIMFLVYLPTIIVLVYYQTKGKNAEFYFGVVSFAYTSIFLNSTFNPLFYGFRNATIREAIWRHVNSITRGIAASSVTLRKVKSIDLQTVDSKYSVEQSTSSKC